MSRLLNEVIASTEGGSTPRPPNVMQFMEELTKIGAEITKLIQEGPQNIIAIEAKLGEGEAAIRTFEADPVLSTTEQLRSSMPTVKNFFAEARRTVKEFKQGQEENEQAQREIEQAQKQIDQNLKEIEKNLVGGGGGGSSGRGGRLRECYLCGCSFRGDGYRRWVTTGRSNWSSTGFSRRGISPRFGSGMRQGLRTVCANCAKELDKGGGWGKIVGWILTGLVVIAGISMCNHSGTTTTSAPARATNYTIENVPGKAPVYTPPAPKPPKLRNCTGPNDQGPCYSG